MPLAQERGDYLCPEGIYERYTEILQKHVAELEREVKKLKRELNEQLENH